MYRLQRNNMNVRISSEDTQLVFVVIILIFIIEIIALSQGINGALLRTSLVIMAGLVGLVIPAPKLMKLLKQVIKK
tara:strand:- start:2914 stop:3141 length:228 start_codon:yes stop_codon:yes gene_type:complete